MGRRAILFVIWLVLQPALRGFHKDIFSATRNFPRKSVFCAERKLGSYEYYLSRTVAGNVALAHGTAFLISGSIRYDLLQKACIVAMGRHPLLRSYVVETSSGDRFWQQCTGDLSSLARNTVMTVQAHSMPDFEQKWKSAFIASINNVTFPTEGPLWRLTQISLHEERSAWVFCSNHAIGDQRSFNMLVTEMLEYLQTRERRPPCQIAPSIETAIAPGPMSLKTLLWAGYQLYNMLSCPIVLPLRLHSSKRNVQLRDPSTRSTFVRYFRLTADATRRISSVARAQRTTTARITVTQVLSAAMLCVGDILLRNVVPSADSQVLKQRLLLAVDLRNFARPAMGEDFTHGTLACASGAVDFLLAPTPALTRLFSEWVQSVISDRPSADTERHAPAMSEELQEQFWRLATQCCQRSERLLRKCDFVPESVRLFDIGMKLQEAGVADIFRATDMDASSPKTLGRGYTCGVSNMGVLRTERGVTLDSARSEESKHVPREGHTDGEKGEVRVQEAYFATSHARNGVLFQLSCMTVDDALCGCLQFTSPITTEVEAETFLALLTGILNSL